MGTRLELGDCVDVLKTLDSNSVDAVVSDPPYGLSFMGKAWDYDVPSVAIWQEVLRVLKPGGYLLSFAGTRTQHRMACAIEDAGFEIRDMIAWVYGSGFPKSLNIGKAVDKMQGNEREVIGKIEQPGSTNNRLAMGNGWQDEPDLTKGTSEWEGWGTALKPALEPITVARKPIEGTVAENCLKWGVGGIDIDGSRVGTEDNLNGGGYNTKGTSQKDLSDATSYATKVMDREFVQPLGRFPANLIHDGSEEVVGLFPNSKGTPALRDMDGEIGYHGNNSGLGMMHTGYSDSGSAARFFYCAKASKSERNMGCEGMEDRQVPSWHFKCGTCGHTYAEQKEKSGCHCENPRPIPWTGTSKNNHPTVKPIALMEYLVKLVSREGATVLDPFMGSGSTGIACVSTGRNFIGIEREAEYLEIAKARIAAVPQKLL